MNKPNATYTHVKAKTLDAEKPSARRSIKTAKQHNNDLKKIIVLRYKEIMPVTKTKSEKKNNSNSRKIQHIETLRESMDFNSP